MVLICGSKCGVLLSLRGQVPSPLIALLKKQEEEKRAAEAAAAAASAAEGKRLLSDAKEQPVRRSLPV